MRHVLQQLFLKEPTSDLPRMKKGKLYLNSLVGTILLFLIPLELNNPAFISRSELYKQDLRLPRLNPSYRKLSLINLIKLRRQIKSEIISI